MIDNKWDEILKDEFEKDYFKKLWKTIEYEYETQKVFPQKNEIFKALELTNFEDVKCVIYAQDPYQSTDKHGNKHAHGLAFSSVSQYEIPKSLNNIYKELESCIDGFQKPSHANLEKWASQGILLLNSALTVRAGESNSHANIGWKTFTDAVIQQLGNSPNPIVFMLWGAYAQKSKKLITGKNKLILEASHPSPLSARHSFFGCKHFLIANQFLIENGLEPIDWQV